MRQKKLEEQRIENERKQKETEAAMKARREELARRDMQRTQYMDEQNRRKAH